ncbi:MAG: MBL fold metallo-hydrolase [Thermoplasmata archaeon]|nr:MBL fold metallo-hydrolase [Thermoplasmata archaeon]
MLRNESRHFRVERLAPGVHAAVATPDGFGLCNSGIVDLGGATVVFDSMLTPMAGAALARAAERCTGRAPDWVVNSHWHGDHIWGNSAFANGHVVSTRRVRQVVLQKSRKQFDDCRREFPAELAKLRAPDPSIHPDDVRELRGWFRGILATPRSHRVVPPEVTFTDELVLEGTRRSLRLISYGGGHSPSDVFGYLPDEQILFTGDLALVGYHLSVGDGWPDEWLRILARMRRLRVDSLLPGHGPLGTAKTLERGQRYLRDLTRIVRSAIRRGTPLAELERTPIPAPYRDWRFAFMFPDNLRRTYRLATAGTPRRTP